MVKAQIKSKDRVSDHGEVFTNEREVNAMLDLVKDESYNIEATFLEPACGDGNFLEVILKRKLQAVDQKYGKTIADYEKYSIIALSSIYGVELLPDNCAACIDRLFSVFKKEYIKHLKTAADTNVLNVAKFILSKNILCGDALTLLKADATPIIFAEWKFISGSKIKRRDFALSKILEAESYNNELADGSDNQLSIFFSCGEEAMKDVYDSVNKPINEYPPVDYKELTKYE